MAINSPKPLESPSTGVDQNINLVAQQQLLNLQGIGSIVTIGSGPGAEQDLGLGMRQPSGMNASQMQFESEEDLLLEDGYAS